MNSLLQVDELVKEYLLFRGFAATFRTLESEIRTDKDKGLQVDKIIDELSNSIQTGDIQALIDYYRYLDIRFFSRLDSRFQRTIKKFELCLLRHYLVHAMQHKKREKVIDFFDSYGPELHGKPEWAQWFALPYLKNPANDPTFETFFSKHWVDNYTTSLHNFLAITIQNMPLPSLLSFNIDRVQKKSQQTEIEALKSIVENQKSTLEARENDIAKLKHEVIETRKEMTDGISLIRRRAASMTVTAPKQSTKQQTTLKKSISTTTHELRPTSTGTNSINTADEEPFLVVGQEEFTEHASAITHAKFSVEGDLIASCDMDNIVRIWSYKGQSFNPLKINNTSSNILSLEWDARSDKFLYLGTDAGLIHVYNVDSKSIVQEFTMGENYKWVNQISSSPTEPVFVCAGSNNRMLSDTENSGALVAWSMKTMSSCGTFHFENEAPYSTINTIKLNHNGTLVVAGDSEGLMRVFDVRSMKPILHWNGTPSCMAQFSFDETSIYSVNNYGELSQWSIRMPGVCVFQRPLEGFPPPAAFLPPRQPSPQILKDINIIPKPTHSTSSISSIRSLSKSVAAYDDTVTQLLLSVTPRSQMVAFSADTDYVLCASTNNTSSQSTTEDQPVRDYCAIHQVTEGVPVMKFAHQPPHHNITTVDWTNSSNACLLGGIDGSVKVTNLIKM